MIRARDSNCQDRILLTQFLFKHLFLLVKEGVPDEGDLESVANGISKNWKKLGRRLLRGEIEAALDDIDKQHESYYEKAYQMLLKWKQAEGCSALFRDLYDALCEVGRTDLAEKFCCEGQ